jgi:PKD repeat protein
MLVVIARRRIPVLVVSWLICGGAGLVMPGLALGSGGNARVIGTFTMRARVTAAVNVRGEHPGQRLTRRWVIVARGCHGSVCTTLELDRQRIDRRHSRIRLHRIGSGRYTGRGVFFAPLSCEGRVYPRGTRVPYKITLTVADTTQVGGVSFARRITARYLNPSRTDTTPCPLGPSHDAARYTGRLTTPLPGAPLAKFYVSVNGANDVASFTDYSYRGRRGARLVSQLWNFGDPASGEADHSTLANPKHLYSAPGNYLVTLTETDASGLVSTKTKIVTAPGPPSAAFRHTQTGRKVTFKNESTRGIGHAPIVAWHWYFDDPTSGAADTSAAQNPVHVFSGPGTYVVTLVVIDSNHRSAKSRETITVSG